jgi:WD40 repeat protein
MDTASLPPLLEHSKGLNHLAFGSDGARLAVADTALNVEVREGDRLVWARSLASTNYKVMGIQRIRGIAFAPDSSALYALASDILYALDAETGEELWRYQPPRALGFLVVSTSSLAVRADGLVAAAFDNGAIGVWTPEGILKGLWKDVDTQRHMAFLPDGRLVGDDSFGLTVFDVSTRKRVRRTSLHDRAFGLATSATGRVAVRTLHEAWQMSPEGEIYSKTPVEPGLPLLAFHPTEPMLALGAAHAVHLVDSEGKKLHRIPVEDTTVVSMAFTPDGRVIVGGADRSVRFLETA